MEMGVNLPFCLEFRTPPSQYKRAARGPVLYQCCTYFFRASRCILCAILHHFFTAIPQFPSRSPSISSPDCQYLYPAVDGMGKRAFFPRKVCQFFCERSAIFAEKSEVFRAKVSNFFRRSLQFFLGHFFSHSGRGAKNVLLFVWFFRFL